MKKVMLRSTGEVFQAEKTNKGANIYRLNGEFVREFAESTFKRYFKPVKDEATVEQPKAEETTKAEKKAAPAPETKKDAKKAAPKAEQPKTKPEPKKDKAAEDSQVEPETAEQPVEVSDEKKAKLIEKIRKMLALSNSDRNPSQEEAMAAALQAQKLMAKYNIHEDEVTLEEIKEGDITSIFTEQKHNSHLMAWRKSLASIVARNFRCKCYTSGQDVVFRGYREDAEIALEVYMNLYTVGDRLAAEAYSTQMKQSGSGKGAYNSFIAGFLTGIQEGFSVQCTALMIVVPKAVEEEFEQFSKNFGHTKVKLTSCDHKLFEQGRAEGKAAVKARQLEEK